MEHDRRQEAREYSREYRRMGFGRLVDRTYYLLHQDEIKRKMRKKYKKKKKNQKKSAKLSQEFS